MTFITIYKIYDNTNGNSYIGQTTQNPKHRLARHLSYIKTGEYCSSSIVLLNNDYEFITLEKCYTFDEANEREKYYIKNTPNCINKVKYTYKYDYSEYQKKFRLENKEKAKEYHKQYKIDNNEKLLKQGRANHHKNKDERNRKRKERQKYYDSWGGNKRSNNNLLLIDINIFT